jgi:hypothetical protein
LVVAEAVLCQKSYMTLEVRYEIHHVFSMSLAILICKPLCPPFLIP